MSDKFSFRGGDPEGVADGDYVLTVAGGHITGLTPASPGGGGSLSVQDEDGTAIAGVTQLDFQGAGVTAAAGTGEVVVTIPGGGSGGGDPGWTAPTLLGTWVNFGAPYGNAGYRKDSNGVVHLRGLVKNGSGGIFTLPTGYRPTADMIFVTHSNSNPSSLIVRAAGGVEYNGGGTAYFVLDGVTFYTT